MVLSSILSTFLKNFLCQWTTIGVRVIHACHHVNDRLRVAVRRHRRTSCPIHDHLDIGKKMSGIADEVNHGTEAPNVSQGGIILKTIVDFRRHVGFCATDCVGVVSAQFITGQKFSKSKVGKLPDGFTAFRISPAKNVVGLQIPIL